MSSNKKIIKKFTMIQICVSLLLSLLILLNLLSITAHLLNKIDKDDYMMLREGAYNSITAYGNSKLSNILFTKELSKKLAQVENNKVAVLCCHPGVCRTELGRYMFEPSSLPIPVSPAVLSAINFFGSPLFSKSCEDSFGCNHFI